MTIRLRFTTNPHVLLQRCMVHFISSNDTVDKDTFFNSNLIDGRSINIVWTHWCWNSMGPACVCVRALSILFSPVCFLSSRTVCFSVHIFLRFFNLPAHTWCFQASIMGIIFTLKITHHDHYLSTIYYDKKTNKNLAICWWQWHLKGVYWIFALTQIKDRWRRKKKSASPFDLSSICRKEFFLNY